MFVDLNFTDKTYIIRAAVYLNRAALIRVLYIVWPWLDSSTWRPTTTNVIPSVFGSFRQEKYPSRWLDLSKPTIQYL